MKQGTNVKEVVLMLGIDSGQEERGNMVRAVIKTNVGSKRERWTKTWTDGSDHLE